MAGRKASAVRTVQPAPRVAGQGARGEGIITLPDGGEAVVLFTNRALVEAEEALGKSILEVAQGFASGELAVGDIIQLLVVGMRAARRDMRIGGPVPTAVDAYAVMDQIGLGKAAAIVIEAVAAVLSYGENEDDTEKDPDPNA